MRKVWVYKRKDVKGWWCGWYEGGRRKAKALPSKELAEHFKQIKYTQLNSDVFIRTLILSCVMRWNNCQLVIGYDGIQGSTWNCWQITSPLVRICGDCGINFPGNRFSCWQDSITVVNEEIKINSELFNSIVFIIKVAYFFLCAMGTVGSVKNKWNLK